MENSITNHAGGTMFSGPKGVDVFRIATLSSGIGLLQNGITPTRGLSMTKALKMATEYTGKKYKRTESDIARADLADILKIKKAEIEIENRGI